jgi:hypothetical protein
MLSGSENDKGFRVWASDGRDGRTWIADVSPVIDNDRGDASEAGKANAKLIALAPEMLAFCRSVLACKGMARSSSGMDLWDRAKALISKAEGR